MKSAKPKHQKHTQLQRPDLGTFARNEWAFLGAPCGLIQDICQRLIEALGKDYKTAYVDADHAHGDESSRNTEPDLIDNSHLVYTDKIKFHRFDLRNNVNTFSYRQWFNEQDLVLVNGNHFQAKQQIVCIDPRKYESLGRKLDRLTDVRGFLKVDPESEIPDFLRKSIPNWASLPQWEVEKTAELSRFIQEEMVANMAPVSALVLAGGKSQRMGTDKGLLSYHGRPQREHLYQLMESLSVTPYLSCRPEQVAELPNGFNYLADSFHGLGPFGAILSAFRYDPNRAWLVIACDLPFVDKESLSYMLQKREPSALATAFYNPQTDFPDPLLTLWEPRAYPVLLQFLAQGYSCPRKVLINSAINLIHAPDIKVLTNVNNPEEYEKARASLSSVD